MTELTHRLATPADAPEIAELMRISILENMTSFWIRCGVGTLLLELGESAARDAGFQTIELGSTIPGEPFYLARGYKEISRDTFVAANGADNVVIMMVKDL